MVPIRALNLKGEKILNEIQVDARKQLFKRMSYINGSHIAYLAVYHKDPLVRKKNLRRILKYLNKKIRMEVKKNKKWKF